jgi:hypothetical protein
LLKGNSLQLAEMALFACSIQRLHSLIPYANLLVTLIAFITSFLVRYCQTYLLVVLMTGASVFGTLITKATIPFSVLAVMMSKTATKTMCGHCSLFLKFHGVYFQGPGTHQLRFGIYVVEVACIL